jgi:EAL domain-containing protein (putative c-di-GMP-specific phosphodiesterase class I)/GGDEF domain-containing protein
MGSRIQIWLHGLRRWAAHGAVVASPAAVGAAVPREAARSSQAAAPRPRPAFDVQADEVEALRRLAHVDAPTGLPNRRHFLGRLRSALAEPGTSGAALLILRLLPPGENRQRLGPEAAGQVPAAVADVLAAYPQRVAGAFAGRLNDSDFALYLPVRGLADETATTLMRALRASPAASLCGAEVVVGGIDGLNGERAGRALAAADQALAQAEAAGPFCAEIHQAAEADEAPIGERAWRVRIDEALAEGRASLAEFPVNDREGRLIHLECPLRVQVDIGGPFREARRWLPMASRSRLLPRVDLVALELALIAIERDGRPRCVHISAASLATAGFVGEVQRRLEGAPRACRGLWLEVAEGPTLERALVRLREAGAAWRRHGVRLGVEHAGASMQNLTRLAGLGLDHVKVEARFVRGADRDADVRNFAAGLVSLVHGMGLQVIAEGMDSAPDLAVLWLLGFDGATGPAVRAASAPG